MCMMLLSETHLCTAKSDFSIDSNGNDKVGQQVENHCLPSQSSIGVSHFVDEGFLAGS